MAMILKNSAMIHIPKTGGTSAKIAMHNAGVEMKLSGTPDMDKFSERQHAHYEHVADEIGQRRVFAFIRKTQDWYTSVWCHHKRERTGNGITGPEHWDEEFGMWFWNVVEECPGHYGKFLNGMLGWARDPLLLRTTHLKQDLVSCLTICHEEFSVAKLVNTPRANVATGEKEDCVWTDSMVRALQDSEGPWDYPLDFMAVHARHFLA